jgi:hypothetical protein
MLTTVSRVPSPCQPSPHRRRGELPPGVVVADQQADPGRAQHRGVPVGVAARQQRLAPGAGPDVHRLARAVIDRLLNEEQIQLAWPAVIEAARR